MIRFLINSAIFLGSSALGILAAWALLNGFEISPSGFVLAIVVFAVAQSVLAPFIFKMATKYASAFVGGIGLVSTFIALFIATLFPGGLSISGVSTWILATLIVWLVTALAAWLLPLIFLKKHVSSKNN